MVIYLYKKIRFRNIPLRMCNCRIHSCCYTLHWRHSYLPQNTRRYLHWRKILIETIKFGWKFKPTDLSHNFLCAVLSDSQADRNVTFLSYEFKRTFTLKTGIKGQLSWSYICPRFGIRCVIQFMHNIHEFLPASKEPTMFFNCGKIVLPDKAKWVLRLVSRY